ncbi:MAG: hypothetical protein AB7G06_03945 [Bdellovibrionales bacterium]
MQKRALDQVVLELLAVAESGDKGRQNELFAALKAECPGADLPSLIGLVAGALTENEIDLKAALDAKPQQDAVFHLARMVYLSRARVDPAARAAHAAVITDDLRAAATGSPDLLLAKFRYLHQRITLGGWDETMTPLLGDILQFPLSPRDVETLGVILFGGGALPQATKLLSEALQAVTGNDSRQVLGFTLVTALMAAGMAPAAQQLQALLPQPAPLPWAQPLPADTYTGPAATVVVTTHISPNLVYYKDSAPPSDLMIRTTLESFYGQLQGPKDWPVLIYFDEPRDPALKEQADAYRAKLEQVAKDYNATLLCRPGLGLRQNLLDALGRIATPYYFFLEHDWTFADHAPPVIDLLMVLEAHHDLHALRYNYNYNLLTRHDPVLMPVPSTLPLLASAHYCNHPGLIRTAKMKRDWLPLLADTQYDAHNGGAGGVEETIYAATLKIIEQHGLLPAIAAMGCAVIGQPGDLPRALHWGI